MVPPSSSGGSIVPLSSNADIAPRGGDLRGAERRDFNRRVVVERRAAFDRAGRAFFVDFDRAVFERVALGRAVLDRVVFRI